MLRTLKIGLFVISLLMLALIVNYRPVSVNFIHFWLWKATTPLPVQSGYYDYRGASLHYTVYGQGEPVLLLHGGLSQQLCWFSQIPWLVQSGRRVVLLDTRGHGDSSHGESVLSYESFAEDALQVLDHLAIVRTDIIGWSDGGITALVLGLQAPERVGRIVAISANFDPSGVLNEVDNSQTASPNVIADTLSEQFQRWWSGAGANYAELNAELNALWLTQPQLKPADLQAIHAPTLVITGENDIIDLPHSGALAQMLAHGRIEIVLGAGHTALFTHSEQINVLIADFLNIPFIP
jgi:pimeloyl-ACP methyl ester carboxylesterase